MFEGENRGGTMAGLIDELVEVMEQENLLYKEMIPVASEKTRIIIKNDLDALQEITDREQRMVEKITALERKREEVIKNIGTVLGKNPDELGMKALIKIMEKQPKEQARLARIHDELSSTLKTLVTLNNRNGILIQQSLEMVEFNMNILQSTRMAPGGNNYTRRAAANDSLPAGQTGMFDAKQ